MGLYLYTVNYFSISLGHDFFSHKGHLWLGIQGWLFGWVMLKKISAESPARPGMMTPKSEAVAQVSPFMMIAWWQDV
jgi:hypothetical protein